MLASKLSQSFIAVATIASSTFCKSDGERETMFKTSLVAVWYSRDSVSSRVRACTSSNNRVFSMAITAWSAKVSSTSICFLVSSKPGWGWARMMVPMPLSWLTRGT